MSRLSRLRVRKSWWLLVTAVLGGGVLLLRAGNPNRMAKPLPNAVPLAASGPAGMARFDARGVEQVWVPDGCFRMGADPARESGNRYETPQRDVCLTAGFWIDKYEVTNASFQQFVDEGGYLDPAYWSEEGRRWKGSQKEPQPVPGEFSEPRQPRVWITWYEAEAYALWRGGRLPTEAQWEYAARGPAATVYPWGDEWNLSLVNVGESGHARPVRVDQYAKGISWCGAIQMAGNVWEWTADWYDADLNRKHVLYDPAGPSSGTERVFRGGSYASLGSRFLWFESPPDSVRTARRSSSDPTARSVTKGTRVVSLVE